ncbi:MAG: WD40/YVTN/BNR-like repeat-containing protein [Candidatus Rokuibacteriota bacterium]
MRFVNLVRTATCLLVAVGVGSTSEPLPAVAWHAKPAATPAFEHVHALTVAADGRTLWLGAHTGLFRSQDGGRTWQPVKLSDKASHLDVMSLVGDSRDGRTLHVGTHEAGVFRTRDGGGSWAQMNTGIGGLDVHGLALDPNEPAEVHAAVMGQGEGVYRTADAGGKWVRVDDGPPGEVKVLASVNVPTGMGGIFLYAGTAEGLLRSPDCF